MMGAQSFFDDVKSGRDARITDASARLRSNCSSPIPKQDGFTQDGHHQQRRTFKAQDVIASTSRSGSGSTMGVNRIGWRIAGGLAVLGLFLLLSNGANRYDYRSPPSYLSSSSSVYKAAQTSMDEVIAKCALRGIHTIACKVEHAAELAEELQARQSTTPQQAVLAYRRRYQRSPPPGFEQWVEFALQHNATVIDDYDQIEVDLNTLRQAGLVGAKLRARIREAKLLFPGYEFGQISVVGGHAVVFGPDVGQLSANTLVEILKPIQHLVPDVTIPFNWFAEPRMPHPASTSSSTALESIDLGGKDPTTVLKQACPSNHITPPLNLRSTIATKTPRS